MFHPKIVYTNPEDDRKNSIVKYIANRVLKNNKNFLCAVTGPTGSGKTYASGSIGELYSAHTGIPYNAEDHVVFTFTEFMDLINNGFKDGRIRIGSIITFDEPQVSVNSRSWQSQANQAFNALVSTFRHKRLVVFFATPFLEYLDLQTRTLFHAEFKMKSVDKKAKMATVEPKFIEYNPKIPKWYYKCLDVVVKDPQKSVYQAHDLKLWQLRIPSKEWVRVYEGKKDEFTNKLNLALAEKMRKVEEAEMGKPKEDQAVVMKRMAEAYQEHGDDVLKIQEIFPQYTINTLDLYIRMIKRSLKARIRSEEAQLAS